ncbi:metallophosphoesterase [Aeromicrobium sp.]|uniref:metallophosphoesterase n=1 Tax=Aeromicrobium sp. TaxID=1871063 RepID=UPI002FC783C1
MVGSFCRGVAVTAAAVLTAGLMSVSPAQAADDITINLVALNDFHGQIDGKVVQWAATVEQLLADGPADNTLLISAGDNVGESSPASAAQDDDPAIDVLNVLGVDASAVGNHEFDRGYNDLVNHIMERADFPILGANVAKSDGSPALDASTTYTVSGVRIAVIGAVTSATPELVKPSGIEGLTFGDPVTAVNTEVDRLNALPASEQPDVIIAAIHEGAPWGSWNLEQAMQSSSIFTRLVEDTSPDVDALIMGHTHITYVYDAPVPGDPNRTRPLIQTGFHGQNVGQIKLTVDSDTGQVNAYTARNVARVTTSDQDLIPTNTKLATIAQIRDDAVAFAAAQSEEAAAVQLELDEAEAAGEDAYAEVQRLKTEYEAAVTARNTAYTEASRLKKIYEAAITAGQAGYAEASRIRQAYDAAVMEARADYAAATSIKQAIDAYAAEGKAAYAVATTVKEAYLAAVAEGKEAYATATRIKLLFDAAVAEGKAAYATAATINASINAYAAEGKAAYEEAARIKQEYQATMAIGDPDSSILLAELTQQYTDAIAAGHAAYAKATALVPDYDAAIAAGKAAYAEATALKPEYEAAAAAGKTAYAKATALIPDYDAAIAAGKTAYAKATALVPDYDAAIAAGKAAYAKAAALIPDYDAAVAAGKAAYAEAAALKPEYDAAIAAVQEASATVSAVKELYDAAIATLNDLIATVAALKEKLLGLL